VRDYSRIREVLKNGTGAASDHMKISDKIYDNASPELAEWVEKQANRTLEFRLKSRAILAAEARTTLNWLYGMAVASGGYVVSLSQSADAPKLWILAPAIVACLASAASAIVLIRSALMISNVPTPGNEPANLLTDDQVQFPLEKQRLAEVAGLQVRIERCLEHNAKAAKAINIARWAIAVIPALGAMFAVVLWLTT